jgi:vacuolar-type H+-ATPase subunit I/STV1
MRPIDAFLKKWDEIQQAAENSQQDLAKMSASIMAPFFPNKSKEQLLADANYQTNLAMNMGLSFGALKDVSKMRSLQEILADANKTKGLSEKIHAELRAAKEELRELLKTKMQKTQKGNLKVLENKTLGSIDEIAEKEREIAKIREMTREVAKKAAVELPKEYTHAAMSASKTKKQLINKLNKGSDSNEQILRGYVPFREQRLLDNFKDIKGKVEGGVPRNVITTPLEEVSSQAPKVENSLDALGRTPGEVSKAERLAKEMARVNKLQDMAEEGGRNIYVPYYGDIHNYRITPKTALREATRPLVEGNENPPLAEVVPFEKIKKLFGR